MHNPLENSNVLRVGSKDSIDNEIGDEVIVGQFNCHLPLSNLPQDVFVANVHIFFSDVGRELLKGNEKALSDLEKFTRKISAEYTSELEKKQSLDAAADAWNRGNYAEMIKYLENVSSDDFPESFKQKIRIALKRLGR